MTTPIDLEVLDNAAALSGELAEAARLWADEIDDADPASEAARTAGLVAKASALVAETFEPSPLEIEPRPLLEILPDCQDALAALAAEVYDDDPDFAETVDKAAAWVESTAPIVADLGVDKASNIHVAGVFRWTGNSTKKIRDLVELIPTEPPISKWVEPCAGSCAIYLGLMHRKPEIFEHCKEVILNDKDAMLIDALKFLRSLRGEAKAAFLARPWVREPERIKRLRAWAPKTKADLIYRFVYLLYSSATRGHVTPPRGSAHKSHWLTEMGRKIPIDHVLSQAARLRGVKLTCEDAVDVIRRHAAEPGTMLAIDPPYSKVNNQGTDWVYGQATGVDYEALAAAVRGAKARTFVLIDRSPQQRKRWSFLNRIFGWKRRDSLAAMTGRGERYYHDEMFSNFGKSIAKADDEAKEPIGKRIVSRGGRFCVLSETTGRSFGCYDTKAEAEARLRQLERFKAAAGDTLRERLAELAHRQWSGWAEHMLARLGGPDADDCVTRWKRQLAASYAELSEAERDADRHEADRVIAVLRETEGARLPALGRDAAAVSKTPNLNAIRESPKTNRLISNARKRAFHSEILRAAGLGAGDTVVELFAGTGNAAAASAPGRHVAFERDAKHAAAYRRKHSGATVVIGDNAETVKAHEWNGAKVALVDADADGSPFEAIRAFLGVYKADRPFVLLSTWGYLPDSIRDGMDRAAAWPALRKKIRALASAAGLEAEPLACAFPAGKMASKNTIYSAFSLAPKGSAHRIKVSQEEIDAAVDEATDKAIDIESAGRSGIRGVTLTSQGYVAIKVGQSHPMADSRGYAYLHNLVWKAAGRRLPKGGGRYSGTDSILDHINRLKDDNRLSNLRPMSRAGHGDRTAGDNFRDRVPGWVRKAFDHADEAEHRIAKADEAERFVLCVVLEPNDGSKGAPLDPDAHKDIYSAEEIYRAAHWYMERYQRHKLQHGRGDLYRGRFLPKSKIQILESTIVRWPGTMTDPQGKQQKIRKGTWLLGLKIHDDQIWQKILRGEITGLSIGGTAVRAPAKGLTLPGGGV
jgi:site-specific DNA-adenine methylase